MLMQSGDISGSVHEGVRRVRRILRRLSANGAVLYRLWQSARQHAWTIANAVCSDQGRPLRSVLHMISLPEGPEEPRLG